MIARLTAIAMLLVCSLQGHADTVKRMKGESPEGFVLRVNPSAIELIHPVIATKEWTPGRFALIAFVSHEYPPPNSSPDLYSLLVTGYLFIPISEDVYDRVKIDTYGPEGRPAAIDSIFFERTAQTGARSLLVLVSWSSSVGDSLYKTYVYAPGNAGKPQYLEGLSLQIDGGCTYCRKDFRTAAEIRKIIRSLVAQQSHAASRDR